MPPACPWALASPALPPSLIEERPLEFCAPFPLSRQAQPVGGAWRPGSLGKEEARGRGRRG